MVRLEGHSGELCRHCPCLNLAFSMDIQRINTLKQIRVNAVREYEEKLRLWKQAEKELTEAYMRIAVIDDKIEKAEEEE